MIFAKEFFDLQFSFAERVHDLSGIPLERCLFEYTNLYLPIRSAQLVTGPDTPVS